VKLRRTAWLLSLLFGVAGCFGTPAASIAIPRASYSVVWPGKSTGESNVPRRELAESRETAPPRTTNSLQVTATNDASAPAALLDPSLFQRPPPV